jgi:hypothetical protein
MIGEPDAGKPPVRFDEGVQETCGIVTRLCPTLRHFPPGKFFAGVPLSWKQECHHGQRAYAKPRWQI